jgi:hypothetical protein
MPPSDKPLVGRPTGRKSTAGRETYITPEGEEVSEKSVTFPIRLENKVVWVNAPSIYDGVRYSEEEVRNKINAGEVKATSVHESREEAEEAAKNRSSGLIKEYAVGGDIVASEDPEANIVENADKTPVSPSQFARGVGTTALQTAKGVATGAVGFAGDVISIAQGVKEVLARTGDQDAADAFVKGMEQKTGLPTTEDVNSFIDQWLPESLQSGSMAQDVGEMSSPGGAAKALVKGARKGVPLLAKEAARQTESMMKKQGLMPSIVPEGETLVKRSPYEAVGLTDEGVEEWRNAHRVQNRQEPIAEVKNAAIKLRDGEISSAEYREIVKQYQPIIPLTEVPKVPTLKELVAALNKDKVETGVVGINKTFKDGDKVASRLDIPAYDNYDTWVVSLHDGTKTGGKSLGYAQTAVLKNVDFRTAPSGALKIATKDKAKETIARIHGDWVNQDPMMVAKRAEEAIKSPEWKQIGMNPYRHSYFYDKADGMPVVEAEEIIQVGPLVLAKKPKYASPDDPQFRIRKNDETSPTFAVGGDVVDSEEKTREEAQLDSLPDLGTPSEENFLSSFRIRRSDPDSEDKNKARKIDAIGTELGDENASITPMVSYSKSSSGTKFDDGVILNETGKRIGIALNGKVKLDEGITVRGGLEKVFSSNETTVYKATDVLYNSKRSSQGQAASLGATVGNVDLDLSKYKNSYGADQTSSSVGYRNDNFNLRYSQNKQDGMPTYKNLSGSMRVGDNLNISGGVDSNKNRNLQVNYRKQFAKGGNVEQMNKLFAEGGMMDDSGEQVNGVEVPPGSLREEVADDIPAQLSEGEFVVPADIVRYIGLEKLMAMRDKAKQGLKRMEEMGQMGNADEVANPDQTFNEQGDEDFAAEIDDIMAEEGSTMPAGFARGGFASGTDLTKASRNPMVDVRFFKNKEGKVMFITHINGVPLVPIPEGFEPTDESYEQLVGSEADKKAAEAAQAEAEELKRLAALGMGASSGGDSPTTPGVSRDPNDLSGAIEIDPKTGQAKGKDFSKYAALAMAILPPPIAVAIQAGVKLSAKQNEEIAKAWNESDKYFNPDAVKGEDKSTGWVSLMKAQESGMGYTVTGTSVSSTKSVQAQNKGLLDDFDLTDEEKAMYAIPGTAKKHISKEKRPLWTERNLLMHLLCKVKVGLERQLEQQQQKRQLIKQQKKLNKQRLH